MNSNLFIRPIVLRWSDFDPNFHLRHSVYYDLGAMARVDFLSEHGVTPAYLAKNHLGPVLFREEAIFRKEIRYGDELTISLLLSQLRRDFSRFSFRHEIKRLDGTLCAVINIDGAWMDTQARKLMSPPAEIIAMAEVAPQSEDFEWV